MVEFTFRKAIEPYEKVTKNRPRRRQRNKVKSWQKERRMKPPELYPIDETIEEEEAEGVLAKYVLIIKIYSLCETNKGVNLNE